MCVVGYMCDWLHVWLAMCVVGYMCGWLHMWLATCVVGDMCDWLHVWFHIARCVGTNSSLQSCPLLDLEVTQEMRVEWMDTDTGHE